MKLTYSILLVCLLIDKIPWLLHKFMHHFRMKLFSLIPCNKKDVSNFWCCCYHFTDSSHFSGSFTCAKIYENIPDASLPEKMSLQVSDGNGAEAVVFFKIQKTNNHFHSYVKMIFMLKHKTFHTWIESKQQNTI